MDVNLTKICQKAEIIFNLTEPDNDYQFLYSTFDILLITVIVPVISLIGILGNSAFLFTIIRIKELRNATVTTYLANLAVCDILLWIFVTAWYVATYMTSPVNGSFPVRSSFGCSIWQISTHWWYLGSLSFITLITVERYLAICKPVQHRNFRGKYLTLKIVIAVWVLSLLLTLTGVPQYSRSVFHCILWPESEEFIDLPITFNDCDPESSAADIYVNLLQILTLILGLIINFVLFAKIIIALRRFSKRSSRSQNVSKQVTRTLLANAIIFFICQVPDRIFAFDDIFDNVGGVDLLRSHYSEALVLLVGRAFLFLNSIINPFLYVLSCKLYREAMLKAICGERCANKTADDPKEYNMQVKDKRISNATNVSTLSSGVSPVLIRKSVLDIDTRGTLLTS
ncbi:kappa-type opioid receptor-like [Amphiura filiformis]|uniref:kappa-type opioid receptor-like n=1 Tax=Amphiura filiformis TaxID=82378 RepID=UPI003B20D5D5